jgi:hypothetical protein
MEKVLSEAASEISSGAVEKGQCEKPYKERKAFAS